ncbi:MAG: DUF2279 domain-containing protein [Hyphomicrobiales bacterium]
MADQSVVRSSKADRVTAAAEVLLPGGEHIPVAALAAPVLGSGTTNFALPPLAGTWAEFENYVDYRLQHIDTPDLGPYKFETFLDQSASIPWDIAGVFAYTSYLGIVNWKWGSATFRFNDEGWFGLDTGSLGTDKLGHAYITYLMSDYFTQAIAHNSDDPRGAALTGATLGMGIQTYVEFFDGFSGDHGFSYEDMVMNGLGAAFSVIRSTVPSAAEKIDFRMEYLPSGNKSFSPISDYSGQKFLLALKLSGFEAFEDTPLRFVELHAGYYARGFTPAEEKRGEPARREPYIGIGLNLQELLSMAPAKDTIPARIARLSLQYVQVPYTYIATSQD